MKDILSRYLVMSVAAMFLWVVHIPKLHPEYFLRIIFFKSLNITWQIQPPTKLLALALTS